MPRNNRRRENSSARKTFSADWVSEDGSTAYAAEADRYHLYVSLACPWASRTVIVRRVQGLENVIGMTVVDPVRDERGWAFRDGPGYSKGPVNGFEFLAETYRATDPNFDAPCRCSGTSSPAGS